MLTITSNTAALQMAALNRNQDQPQPIQRLSSGLRTNSADLAPGNNISSGTRINAVAASNAEDPRRESLKTKKC